MVLDVLKSWAERTSLPPPRAPLGSLGRMQEVGLTLGFHLVLLGPCSQLDLPSVNGDYQHPAEKFCSLRTCQASCRRPHLHWHPSLAAPPSLGSSLWPCPVLAPSRDPRSFVTGWVAPRKDEQVAVSLRIWYQTSSVSTKWELLGNADS